MKHDMSTTMPTIWQHLARLCWYHHKFHQPRPKSLSIQFSPEPRHNIPITMRPTNATIITSPSGNTLIITESGHLDSAHPTSLATYQHANANNIKLHSHNSIIGKKCLLTYQHNYPTLP